MRYWKVYWHHDFTEEPIAIYSEITDSGDERRRVEEFRGGRTGWADEERQHGGTSLADVRIGHIDEVTSQPEFTGFVINGKEFQGAWDRATALP